MRDRDATSGRGLQGWRVVDKSSHPVLADPFGNNVAFRCLGCGAPVLAIVRVYQRGSAADRPASCPACRSEFWVEKDASNRLLTVFRVPLDGNPSRQLSLDMSDRGEDASGESEGEAEEDEDDDEEDDDDSFPWDHVDTSRHDSRLQAKHNATQARRQYGDDLQCPSCSRSADDLAWFYFISPEWTWEHLCGRAGWMVVCDSCHLQVRFFVEVMN